MTWNELEAAQIQLKGSHANCLHRQLKSSRSPNSNVSGVMNPNEARRSISTCLWFTERAQMPLPIFLVDIAKMPIEIHHLRPARWARRFLPWWLPFQACLPPHAMSGSGNQPCFLHITACGNPPCFLKNKSAHGIRDHTSLRTRFRDAIGGNRRGRVKIRGARPKSIDAN